MLRVHNGQARRVEGASRDARARLHSARRLLLHSGSAEGATTLSVGISFRIHDDRVRFVEDQVQVCRDVASAGTRVAAGALFTETMPAMVEHVLKEDPGRDTERREFFTSLTLDTPVFADPAREAGT